MMYDWLDDIAADAEAERKKDINRLTVDEYLDLNH